MNLGSPRAALTISIGVCLVVTLAGNAGCSTAPAREVALTWIAAPNAAATCASVGLAYRNGGCVVAKGESCTIYTAADHVRYADLGANFRECLR